MAKAKKKLEAQMTEAQVVDLMVEAQRIAEETFGSKWDTFAVDEIADCLEAIGDGDPTEFLSDLKRTYGYAQRIYKTQTPDSEQVFNLIDRLWPQEEEE